MQKPVKRRRYESTRRREAASDTRQAILEAARQLFVERGYGGTTMAAVAETAQVALDTVYASVGTKPELLRLLIETAISGTDSPVEAEQRDYVRAIHAETDPGKKLEVYASAIGTLQPRLAPLLHVLQAAAPAHPALAALWQEIGQRRAANMRLMAAELAESGKLATSVEEAADVIWIMNSPEFYALSVQQRGWSLERYQTWLAETWKRLLL
jgi:AcrR family transcriptional regulator